MHTQEWKPRLLPLVLLAVSLCVCVLPPVADTAIAGDSSGIITLRRALVLALMQNPELSGFSWELRAAEARSLQAGLLPNPEVGIEIEDFGGSEERSGFDGAQTTISLSQLIELGDKRSKRARVAAIQRDLAGWDYETKRLDVLTEVTRSFVDVLGAQKRMAWAEELVGLAETTYRTVLERVEAGKVSPLEATKASVSLSDTKIEYQRARSDLAVARKKLAATWGDTTPVFEGTEGDLDCLSPVPAAEELEKRISRNPDIARGEKALEQAAAALEMEKAKRIPDLTVTGGIRRFNETDDNAFVAGISMPLPIFDRNPGGVLEARHKLTKAKESSRVAEVRVSASLAESYHALSFAYEQSMALRNQVLPASEHAFRATGEGYREGKFDFLEFLDAQRTLFEERGKYLEALIAYHKAKTDVERLIGESIERIKKGIDHEK